MIFYMEFLFAGKPMLHLRVEGHVNPTKNIARGFQVSLDRSVKFKVPLLLPSLCNLHCVNFVLLD